MSRWINAILVYVLVIGLLVYLKPATMFDNEEKVKKWGLDNSESESMFSPMIAFPVLAILSYYVAVFIETAIAI